MLSTIGAILRLALRLLLHLLLFLSRLPIQVAVLLPVDGLGLHFVVDDDISANRLLIVSKLYLDLLGGKQSSLLPDAVVIVVRVL